MNGDASSLKLFYGYRLVVTSSQPDGTYHHRAAARVEVRSEDSDEACMSWNVRPTESSAERAPPASR